MKIVPEIAALVPDMRTWRHHIHAHPETAFKEVATGAFVADKLRSFGLEVHTGLAKTGVVGALRCGSGSDAIAAATAVVGAANVDTEPTPEMGSEDFAFMLQAKPGCYVWLGAGRGPDTPNVHNPHYDFNDNALAIGAGYWVMLARQQLAA